MSIYITSEARVFEGVFTSLSVFELIKQFYGLKMYEIVNHIIIINIYPKNIPIHRDNSLHYYPIKSFRTCLQDNFCLNSIHGQSIWFTTGIST